MIPLTVFGRHMRSLNAMIADEQKRGVHEVAHGIAITLSGDSPGVVQETKRLDQQAAPPQE